MRLLSVADTCHVDWACKPSQLKLQQKRARRGGKVLCVRYEYEEEKKIEKVCG